MMDYTPDPHRLHPDGAPGTQERLLRSQWGDSAYEQFRNRGERLNTIEEARLDAVRTQFEQRARREEAIADVWGTVALILQAAFLIGVIVATLVLWRAR